MRITASPVAVPRVLEENVECVVDDQDAVLAADRGEAPEIILRRDDVAARALHRLDEDRAELRAAGLRVPRAGVLVLEAPLELGDAVVFGLLGVAAVG